MRCAFSPLAEADLEAIGNYIARDNPRGALSFIGAVRERCERITAWPRAAPLRPELAEGIRVIAFRGYLICYTVSDQVVLIERIVHGSRYLDDLF